MLSSIMSPVRRAETAKGNERNKYGMIKKDPTSQKAKFLENET